MSHGPRYLLVSAAVSAGVHASLLTGLAVYGWFAGTDKLWQWGARERPALRLAVVDPVPPPVELRPDETLSVDSPSVEIPITPPAPVPRENAPRVTFDPQGLAAIPPRAVEAPHVSPPAMPPRAATAVVIEPVFPLPREFPPRLPRDASVDLAAVDPIPLPPPPVLFDGPPPVYPPLLAHYAWEGTVVLRVTIDATGNVTDLSVHAPSGQPLADAAALAAVRHWQARPLPPAARLASMSFLKPIAFRLLK